MNRTIKETTVKHYHYDTHRQLETHPQNFIAADPYARRLKTPRGLTPYEFICKVWGEQPHRFTTNPHNQLPDQTPSHLRRRKAERGHL